MSWRSELESWLAPFLEVLQHKTRARMCPAYVAGLIGAGDRKSVQPMAARDHQVGYDQLHHFVAAGVWDSGPLEAALLKKADGLVGDKAGFLVIDDTTLAKKDVTRLASRRNMPRRSERLPTANRWSR